MQQRPNYISKAIWYLTSKAIFKTEKHQFRVQYGLASRYKIPLSYINKYLNVQYGLVAT